MQVLRDLLLRVSFVLVECTTRYYDVDSACSKSTDKLNGKKATMSRMLVVFR